MRPIKYRAFHKDLKITREVCTLRLDFNEVIVKYEECGWTDKTTWFEGQFELMQFTGHKDNKLIDIYQGDIFKRPYHEYELYIVDDLLDFGFNLYEFWMDTDFIEIIGNKWENPELLETK